MKKEHGIEEAEYDKRKKEKEDKKIKDDSLDERLSFLESEHGIIPKKGE